MSKQAAEHYHEAAEHHEHAARHHEEAAKHHEEGSTKRQHTMRILRTVTTNTRCTTHRKPLRPISSIMEGPHGSRLDWQGRVAHPP